MRIGNVSKYRIMEEKVMKKILTALGLAAIAGGLTVGAVKLGTKKVEQVKADEVVTKYLPMNDTNFYRGGFSDVAMGNLISGRFETFHGDRRSYNAMDNFLNTMAKVGEGETGWVRSVRWVHKGGYVSFLLGGNGNNFVNIWAEPEEGKENGANVFANIKNDFHASRDSYDSAYENGEASDFELSANMALKYFYIPDEYIGRELIVYIEDCTTSYYGGVVFGDLRVNQTLEEVARTFAAHKQQIALDAQSTTQNNYSATYMLNTYYVGAGYSALATAESSLDNADEGFETYGLSNWAYDRAFSNANINVATIVSNNDAKDWTERMPANKTGNLYVNADGSGIAEDAKYRLISNEFTLSGTGFISAKLGGGTAVMSLIDSTGAELVTSRIAEATGTNILNKGFVDNGGVGNIMSSGSRFNTMSRTYLDASAHLGKKVRVVLSDDRTGGNWGLAYFDEVVTKYASVPTFKVDKIQQQWNESPLYHGVVVDQYVGSASTDFGKAYDFVTRYYGLMRSSAHGFSWCTISEDDDVKALLAEYKTLTANVANIVSASMDYSFGASATSENFYLTEADVSYTIGQTMTALDNELSPSSNKTIAMFDTNASAITFIIVVSVLGIAVASLVAAYSVLKKRKEQ